MTAKVYVDPFTRNVLMSDNVKVLELSPAPRVTKEGKLFKYPFEGSHWLTSEQSLLLTLWEKGIRKAKVKYPDGSIDINVFVHVNDIIQ